MADTFDQWWDDNKSTMMGFEDSFVLDRVYSIAKRAWLAARGEDKPKEPETRPYTMELIYKLCYKRHAVVQDLGTGQFTSKDEAVKATKAKGLEFLEQFKPAELETWDVRVRPARS